MYYEVYVKPEGGPCMVQERDLKGNHAWVGKHEAISIADGKKRLHPHMDFLVHEVAGHHRPRTVVYDTSEPAKSEDFTARQLVDNKYTLYQVHALVTSGRISEATAQEFAREWVAGKCEYRFNEAERCLEEALTIRESGPTNWHRYGWR